MTCPDSLLRPADVEAEFGISAKTLETWRRRGIGPHWFHHGPRRVVYRRSVVKAWTDDQERLAQRASA